MNSGRSQTLFALSSLSGVMSSTLEFAASTCATPVNVIHEVLALQDEIIENRRWFHANPELSFQEVKTAAKVSK